MKLLDLTALQLKAKGFVQEMLSDRVIYTSKTINGYFMFNPLFEKERWYHVTVIGDSTNSVMLGIQTEQDLDLLLRLWDC